MPWRDIRLFGDNGFLFTMAWIILSPNTAVAGTARMYAWPALYIFRDFDSVAPGAEVTWPDGARAMEVRAVIMHFIIYFM
jgi:hypothetical protein